MTRSVRFYVASCSAALWLGLACAVALGHLDILRQPAQIAPLLGLVVAVEALVVRERNRGRANLQSFSATAHIATAVIFGPAVAALLAAVGVVLVDSLQGAPRRVVMMNSAMFGCAIGVAGIAFEAAGGTVGTVSASDLLPLALMIAVRFAVNELMLGIVVTLDSGARFGDVIRDQLHGSLGSELGQGCLGVLFAFVYTTGTWVILPFTVPLLLALYRAESNFERLKSETGDVLHQLATIIDERDQNTADHTRRVADYVRRFAEAISLGERETERLVQAAQYHDLGKIAVDVATLSKSGRLDEAELQAIRRHPRLSARLLAPFHFAQKIALYAELHHERYDGRGYYRVAPEDVPIEAHVLIVADSFDAMTSNRPYRPGLPTDDAIAELEANAGTQFDPMVAAAFAAVIRGDDLADALGRDRLAALRAQFTTLPIADLGWLRTMPPSSSITVALASTTLVCLGIDRLPGVVAGAAALATLAFGSLTVVQSQHRRRARRSALAALSRGASPSEALAAAGIAGWVAWFTTDEHRDAYTAWPVTWPADPDDLEHAAALAMRPTVDHSLGRLPSGTYVTVSEPNDLGMRLVVGTPARPGREHREVVEYIAAAARPRPGETHDADRRTSELGGRRAGDTGVLLVELGVFDGVHRAAGQLFAQRVVGEAARRVATLLRAEDQLIEIGDDRLGVVVRVANQEQLDGICDRIHAALSDLPVPRGADRPVPRVRAALAEAALTDPDLAELIGDDDHLAARRKAG